MMYQSTRGSAPASSFEDALLSGLAADGGLYVPAAWPKLTTHDIRALADLDYADLVARVIQPFVGDAISNNDLTQMSRDAYTGFGHSAVAPLRQIDSRHWLLELFHGPTLSFKDYALQLVGRLFDHVLARRGTRIAIVGATSGDTGSAAIEACRDRGAIDIVMLHPAGRVSDVQRRQMTSVDAPNVFNVALDGTFDDCQDMVKALFADQGMRRHYNLSAVNSINWARIMVQIAYYFAAAVALGAPQRRLSFAVPTGNFGNVYSAYGARRMGLPIERLAIGSNANDILTRFFESGEMVIDPVRPSLSPSMDVQVSSNFERLLFEYCSRNGATVERLMTRFRRDGRVSLGRARWRRMSRLFQGHRLDDEGTTALMRKVFTETGMVVDPHTAVGIAAGHALAADSDCPVVSVATAHPAKFPDAVEKAIGRRPDLPPHLADLLNRPERCVSLPNQVEAVRDYVASVVRGANNA